MTQDTQPSVYFQFLSVYTQPSYAFDDLGSLIIIPCYTHMHIRMLMKTLVTYIQFLLFKLSASKNLLKQIESLNILMIRLYEFLFYLILLK